MPATHELIQQLKDVRANVKDRQRWMAAYEDLTPNLRAVIRRIFVAEQHQQRWDIFEKNAFDGNLITKTGEALLDKLEQALFEKTSLRSVLGQLLEVDIGL